MLGDVTAAEVKRIVSESLERGRTPIPQLGDEAVRQRAKELARQQGLFERIERELAWDKPVPILPRSVYRRFRRIGDRRQYEQALFWREGQIDLAAMACWLGLDRLDYLQDLLWAQCEASTWVMPAHERPDSPIDLFAAMTAREYATLARLLAGQLEPEVSQRLSDEIKRRVLDMYLDPRVEHWWQDCTNNWNAVCHGDIGLAAMLLETDARRLAAILIKILEELPPFLDGFTADGGCTEGPGYWAFGFGWYVHFAAGLFDFTGGRINIMRGEKLERICRYPLSVTVAPGQPLAFADVNPSYLPALTAMQINRFYPLPELFGLCELLPDGVLRVNDLRTLTAYDGARYAPPAAWSDACLPELAVAMIRQAGVTVGAKAGHNDEHHNHNDIGTFVLHRGRTFFLDDLGAPVYSARTFSPRRYESVFCNSFGHSVPVVDGAFQQEGRQSAGTLAVENPRGRGAKRLVIELAQAYRQPNLASLRRTLELSAGGELLLADEFAFAQAPRALEEGFVTLCQAQAVEGDRPCGSTRRPMGHACCAPWTRRGILRWPSCPRRPKSSATGRWCGGYVLCRKVWPSA